MKTERILIVVFGVVLLASCRKPTLQLSEDGTKNVEAVAFYVPNGMDKETAVERMTEAGFTCQVIESGTIVGVESTTGSEDMVGGSMSVIICDKQPESPGGDSYKIILQLDDAGHVKSHGISQGPSEE